MSAINIVAIESALVQWVSAGTGLATTQIAWSDGTPRPLGTYCSLSLEGPTPLGTDELSYAEVGGNIAETATGLREMRLDVQCFATEHKGTGHARMILGDLVARAALSSMGARLQAVNLGLIGLTEVTTTPRIENAVVFEPRAIVGVRFYTTSTIVDTSTDGSGSIDTVEITNGITSTLHTVTRPADAT